VITLMPGGITTVMIEFADQQPIAGRRRRCPGTAQVVLPVAGQPLVGIYPAQAFAQRATICSVGERPGSERAYSPSACTCASSARPMRSPDLLVVVYVARVGVLRGTQFLADYLGGFLGPALMALVVAATADRLGAALESRVPQPQYAERRS
jgi:hypothetical protein